MVVDLVSRFPIAVTGLALVIVAVVGGLGGLLLFHRYVPVAVRREHNDVAGFIIAVVGVIYAVLLAFIAIAVWQDFNEAEAIVENEASLAGDIFLDAIDVAEPVGSQIRGDIREYVATVAHDEWPALAEGHIPARTPEALLRLQTALVRVVDRGPVFEEILSRLNSLYDARRERLNHAARGLQPIAWFVLLAGAVLTIAFTYLFGVPDLRLHMAMTGILAASIAFVILLIVAFDYPFRGDVAITPAPFVEVLGSMK